MRLLLAILIALPVCGRAEPSEVIQRMMDEPASLFDVAMLRLHRIADQVEKTLSPRGNVNANYYTDTDRFVIGYSAFNSPKPPDDMYAACERALGQISVFVSKSVPRIFMHAGEKLDRAESGDLRSEMLPKFDFYCVFYGRDSADVLFRATLKPGDAEMTIQVGLH